MNHKINLDNKDLKIGEFVYITRKQPAYSGWEYNWNTKMDSTVGKKFEIVTEYNRSDDHINFTLKTNVIQDFYNFVYPDFVLSRNKKHCGKLPKEPKWKKIWRDS